MTKKTGSVEHVAFARNYVGGHWVDPSGARLPVFNPATGHQIAEVGVSTAADLVAAVDVAQAAFLPWRNTPPVERARPLFRFKHLMEAHFEELAQLVTLDHGKTLEDARGEVRRAIENVEVACGIPTLMMGYGLEDGAARGIDEHAIRQPLGVFAAVVPFKIGRAHV